MLIAATLAVRTTQPPSGNESVLMVKLTEAVESSRSPFDAFVSGPLAENDVVGSEL